jgi:hypothetical protein
MESHFDASSSPGTRRWLPATVEVDGMDLTFVVCHAGTGARLGARRGITASRWCRVRRPAGTTVTGRQRRRRWRREGRRIPRRQRRSEEVLRPGGGGDRVDGEANGPLSCRRYVTPTAASSRRCRGGVHPTSWRGSGGVNPVAEGECGGGAGRRRVVEAEDDVDGAARGLRRWG